MLRFTLPALDEMPTIAWCSGQPGGRCTDAKFSFSRRAAQETFTFRSKSGLEIEVVELSDSRFEELVDMYDAFEPKRGAQGLPPIGRERIVKWLRQLQTHDYNLLALSDNRVIGHSMLCPLDAERAEFAIFLDQNFRNQGIGTGLTEATLDYARRLKLRNVWLSVETNNRWAVRVYRKTGFRVSGLFGPEQEMALDLKDSKTDGRTSDDET
jgi:RimJ/RimL family protein N-acetyltransferase